MVYHTIFVAKNETDEMLQMKDRTQPYQRAEIHSAVGLRGSTEFTTPWGFVTMQVVDRFVMGTIKLIFTQSQGYV